MSSFFIVAVDSNWGIAKDHKIPWHYKEDFAFFKDITQGKTCVMGYNTFAEIAQMRGYPETKKVLLPGRPSLVLTSSSAHVNNDVTLIASLNYTATISEQMVFIGGKGVYDYAMGDYLASSPYGYVTRIKADHDCDMFYDHETLHKYFDPEPIPVRETDDFVIQRWNRKDYISFLLRTEFKNYER